MVESLEVFRTSNGKRRKIMHSEPLFPTLISVVTGNAQDDESDTDDFSCFDPSDDEDSDGVPWLLTTNRTYEDDRERTDHLVEGRYLGSNNQRTNMECPAAEVDAANFKWVYDVEEGPDLPPTPIWEFRVTRATLTQSQRGREWDVVCSVLEIARHYPDDYDILSASATPAVSGKVYIECTFESVARQLLLHVAFTRRLVAPRQISAEALKSNLSLASPPIREGSWVRIRTSGEYKQDLAWVQHYDAETDCALLYLVPRWQIGEDAQRNSGTEEGAERSPSVSKIQSHQSLLRHHLDDSVDPAIQSLIYGQFFHFGFLLCRKPLNGLETYRVRSSIQELAPWTKSPMYDFANRSIVLQHGDRVYQIAELFASSDIAFTLFRREVVLESVQAPNMDDTVQLSPNIPPPPPPSPAHKGSTEDHLPVEKDKPRGFYGPDGRILLWDDPVERAERPSGMSVTVKTDNIYTPQGRIPVAGRPRSTDGSHVHDNYSSDFRLRGIDSPLPPYSPQPTTDNDFRLHDSVIEGKCDSVAGSNALGLIFEPEIPMDEAPTWDSYAFEERDRLTRCSPTSDDGMSTLFVSPDELSGHGDSCDLCLSTHGVRSRTETHFDYSDSRSRYAESSDSYVADPQHTAIILHRVSAFDGDVLNIDPILPNRFTAELRNRMMLGFKDGNVPDFDTFKSMLYAPVVLAMTSGDREDLPLKVYSPQYDGECFWLYWYLWTLIVVDWSSDAVSLPSDEELELTYPEHSATNSAACTTNIEDGATDEDASHMSPLLEPGEGSVQVRRESSAGAIVYLEDFETYGEDLLASRKKLPSSLSTRKRKKKPASQDRKITSFFGRIHQRRVKAALVRRLRRPARSVALSGPAGSSLASATHYNPRVHRPEVIPTANSRLPKVQGSGSYVGGERVGRAFPLRVEDLYIGYPKSAPVVAPRRASHQCPICRQLLSHPVILGCRDVVCYVCIRVYLEHKWDCPVCRTIVTDDPIIADSREREIEAEYGTWDDTPTGRTKRRLKPKRD
ncbi:hypothetical protein R3P38DRAFT_2784140 [Favolaschia claudopus]|uniref:RING-type domain-containing protein n=1 Tax=Favolaschia claudopus TaxID=2862362 RepID=A0AAW0AXD8_9AGAR